MSILKKSLTRNKIISKTKKVLYNNSLDSDRKYLVTIFENLKSVDVPQSKFKNFISLKSDTDIINQLKKLKQIKDNYIPIKDLPISPPQEEDNAYLVNKNGDALSNIRYECIKKEIGFNEKVTDLLKFEFSSDDKHRVYVILDLENKIIKILFSDPFHHLAYSDKSIAKMHWTYERCKIKNDCISAIFNEKSEL